MTGYRPRGGGREPVGEVDVFARPGQQATAQVQVFTRRASGLVRVMSPYSAFAYNILNIGIIFPWVYITTIILYPGASIWLGIFITGVFTGFLAVVYAGLASAMPRTGGDYVFQSRTLRPWLGFAIVSTMIITFFLQWQALGGWLVAILGFAPLFTGLGLTTGNTMFIDWGVWFSTPMGAMVTTMVTSTFAALILIKSFRWFVQIQWVMWYGFLLSYLVMVVMFFITPTATFIGRYDRAATIIAGSGPGAYQGVLSNAIANGFTPNRAFDLLGTLLITPVALTSLGWVGYAQEQAGEIQGAQSLRNQMFINLGGGLVSRRTHTPVNAHVIFLILGGFLYAYIYNMVPGYTTYTLAVTAVATVMYIGTAIGGAVFPRTRREVYQTSPIAKYKVGRVPLITICGLIAAGFSAWMLYWYITEPFLGIANLSAGFDGVKSLLIMLAIFVGWTAYYFVRRAYLRSRGINLDLAYKEVPPI